MRSDASLMLLNTSVLTGMVRAPAWQRGMFGLVTGRLSPSPDCCSSPRRASGPAAPGPFGLAARPEMSPSSATRAGGTSERGCSGQGSRVGMRVTVVSTPCSAAARGTPNSGGVASGAASELSRMLEPWRTCRPPDFCVMSDAACDRQLAAVACVMSPSETRASRPPAPSTTFCCATAVMPLPLSRKMPLAARIEIMLPASKMMLLSARTLRFCSARMETLFWL